MWVIRPLRRGGGGQVDALREMKKFRRGIHSLEWENERLEMQVRRVARPVVRPISFI